MISEISVVKNMKKQIKESIDLQSESIMPTDEQGEYTDDFRYFYYCIQSGLIYTLIYCIIRTHMIKRCDEYMQQANQKCKEVIRWDFIGKFCFRAFTSVGTGDLEHLAGSAGKAALSALSLFPGFSIICSIIGVSALASCEKFITSDYCNEMPDDHSLIQSENKLKNMENDILDEFNLNADFNVEKPNFDTMPDYRYYRRSLIGLMLF